MHTASQFAAGVFSLSFAAASFAGVADRGFFEWDIEFLPPGVELFGGADEADVTPGAVTFRLHFVANESLSLNGFNLGTLANPGLTPERIYFNGTVFNHAFGGDSQPNQALIPAFPELAFDSYFAIGNQAISFVPGSQNLSGANGEIIGTWFTQPPIAMNAGDRLLALQVTIQALPDSWIGGNGSSIGVGFADNTTAVFDVPLARIPSPGACGMLALAGAVASRRRRS